MSDKITNEEIVNNDMDNLKDYLKVAFESGSAYTETFIDQLKKDFPDLNTDAYKSIKNITTKGVGVSLTYDTDKTVGENLSSISGDMVQGGISSAITKGGLVLALGVVEAPAIAVFAGGFFLNEGLKLVGIDLGKEAQAIYIDYTSSLIEMEVAYIKAQQEYPSVFNSDGSIIGDNQQLSLNGNIIEKYKGLTKALENNNVDTSGLKGLLDKGKDSQNKVNSLQKQLDIKLPEAPNENSKIEVEYNSDNSVEIKHPNNTTDIISNNVKTTYDENNNQTSTTSLKDGQTISHIALNTKYNSIELLEYNNLTLEQARNLPIGFEVQIPKDVTQIETPQGNIKLFENYDGSETAILPESITGTKTIINFDDDSSTLLYGDRTNPDKITYVDDIASYTRYERKVA